MFERMIDRASEAAAGYVRAPARAVVVRRLALLLVAGAALALVATQVLLPWVRSYLYGATRLEILERAEHVMYAIAALLVVGGVVALVHGVRILRAGRWPLPGAFVFRDTKIETGTRATVRGAVLVLAAVLQFGLAVWTAMLPRMLYGSLSFA